MLPDHLPAVALLLSGQRRPFARQNITASKSLA
jgi:hypothetical protein